MSAQTITVEEIETLGHDLAIARRRTDEARHVWANVFWGEATTDERRSAWATLEACKNAEALAVEQYEALVLEATEETA
jgi:hypothetical protein